MAYNRKLAASIARNPPLSGAEALRAHANFLLRLERAHVPLAASEMDVLVKSGFAPLENPRP